MTPKSSGLSLLQVAAEVRDSAERGDANDALRLVIQFLDDIERADDTSRRNAIRDEPDSTGDPHWDALLAGVAEYVSRRSGFTSPGWTAAPSRFLHQFWFVIEDILGRPAPGLAALSFAASPPELANRGVFLDRASLVSV